MSDIKSTLFNKLLHIVYSHVNDAIELKKNNEFDLIKYIEQHKLGNSIGSSIEDKFKYHYQNIYLQEEELEKRKQSLISFNKSLSKFQDELKEKGLESLFSELFDAVKKEIKSNSKYAYFLSSNGTSLIKQSHRETNKLTFNFPFLKESLALLKHSEDLISKFALNIKQVIVYTNNLKKIFVIDEQDYIHEILIENFNIDILMGNTKDIKIEKVNVSSEKVLIDKLINISNNKYIVNLLGVKHFKFENQFNTTYYCVLQDGIRVLHREDGKPSVSDSFRKKEFYYINGELVSKSKAETYALSKTFNLF